MDKNPMAWSLAQEAGYYFLSRPRRFGKSLFLDTLKDLFEGNQALFEGLFIHDLWDWNVRHPVIRISFGGGVLKQREDLNQVLHQQLEVHERKFKLPARYPDTRSRFADLIARAQEQSGQNVVVLIDEYDKPILDNLSDNLSDSAMAVVMRESLKDFYSIIKDMDAHLRFVFLTGVSKFSKVSLFSGLNNLNDITLDPAYSAIYAEQTLPSKKIVYTLGYPNLEVEMSLNASLLTCYTDDASKSSKQRLHLEEMLLANDIAAMRDLFQSLFAGIPHAWYDNNPIAHYEGYYASVFYSYFAALGYDLRVEDATNHGRIDMTIILPENIYLFEFKVVELLPAGKALQQLRDRRYADKYRAHGLPIYLIGIDFSREQRNVVGFEAQLVDYM